MTRPKIYDLFNFFKDRAGHPVDFFEVRATWPYIKPGELRSVCSKLVHQGYIVRLDFNLYQYAG